MVKELEDLPQHGLKLGDLGTVVLIDAAGGYEVEFMTLDGQTLTVWSRCFLIRYVPWAEGRSPGHARWPRQRTRACRPCNDHKLDRHYGFKDFIINDIKYRMVRDTEGGEE